MDLAHTSLQKLRFLENKSELNKGNFIRFALKATKSQHHALGAEIRVVTGHTTQRDYVKLTAGFQTQVPGELHFGLGENTMANRVEVYWPSGAISLFKNVSGNAKYFIEEGIRSQRSTHFTIPIKFNSNEILSEDLSKCYVNGLPNGDLSPTFNRMQSQYNLGEFIPVKNGFIRLSLNIYTEEQ